MTRHPQAVVAKPSVKSTDYGHVGVIDGCNFVKGTGSYNGGAIVI